MSIEKDSLHFGIDLGGTKIELIVLDQSHQILYRKRIDTQAELGVQHILDQIKTLYEQANQLFPLHTLGVGTPGSISSVTGLLRNSNTTCLNGLPLQKLLEDILGHRTRCENDANCFALAESLMGSGRGYDCVFGVIIGTGCGGGWTFNQTLRKGPQRIAGEWGHMVLNPRGLSCFCGQNGCVETFISGSGVERQFALLMGKDSSSSRVSSEEIFRLASIEDIETYEEKTEISLNTLPKENTKVNAALIASAKRVVDDFYSNLGQALANLINTVDPDVVVLGGGLSNIGGIAKRAQMEVQTRVFTGEFTTPILRHTLGDSAGVIGAALIGANPKL